MNKLNLLVFFSLLFMLDCKIKDQTIKKDFTLDMGYCAEAEKNLLKLDCKEGKPTKRGKTFYQFCQETESNGIFLNAQCLTKITNCNQINECTGSE